MSKCLVLDLDGTITDSLPDIAAALNRSLARHGKDPLPLARGAADGGRWRRPALPARLCGARPGALA